MPKLILKKKAEILREYVIAKQVVTVGSAPGNDIIINDPQVSTQHCELRASNDRYEVTDSKSAYGTMLNGSPIKTSELRWEDRISAGHHDLIFRPAPNDKGPEQSPERYWLLGIYGICLGKTYELNSQETRIGRDEEYNEIVIPGSSDPSVSRRHATISVQENAYVLTDKRSRNRTFIGQHQISETESITLKENDEILIGRSIFRFVKEGSKNYAPPKTAGIFWARYKSKIIASAFGIIMLGAVFSLYSGFYGILILKSTPKPFSAWRITWNPEMRQQDLAAKAQETYDVSSSPALGDINGDGAAEIVCVNSQGAVYAWSGAKGNFIWNAPPELGGHITASPALADFNKDGADDIALVTTDSRIVILDGVSGAIIAKSNILGGVLTSVCIADLDRDGLLDCVVGSDDGTLHFFYAPVAGAQLFSVPVKEPILGAPTAFAGPQKTFVVAGTLQGNIIIADGASREYDTIETTESINKFLGTHIPVNEIASTPVVRDITKDGVPDIVVMSKQALVSVFDSKTRDIHWVYNAEEATKPEQVTPQTASPALSDMDGDGSPDVVTALPNGLVVALKGTNGNLFWDYPLARNSRLISSPALADLTKDGRPEILLGTESGTLTVLDGSPVRLPPEERVLLKEKAGQAPISSSVVIGDMTRDGYLEILTAGTSDDLSLWSTNSRHFKNQLVWPQLSHDGAHSGYLPVREDLMSYAARASFGMLILAMLLTLQHFAHKTNLEKRPRTSKIA